MEDGRLVPRRIRKRQVDGQIIAQAPSETSGSHHGDQVERVDGLVLPISYPPPQPTTPTRKARYSLAERQNQLKHVQHLGTAPLSPPPTRHKGRSVGRQDTTASSVRDRLECLNAQISDTLPEVARALWSIYRAVEQSILLLIGAGELVQIMEREDDLFGPVQRPSAHVAVSFLALKPAVERAASRACTEDHLAQLAWMWEQIGRNSRSPGYRIHPIRTIDKTSSSARSKRIHTFAIAITEVNDRHTQSANCVCVSCGDTHLPSAKRARQQSSEMAQYGIGNLVGRWSAAVESRQAAFAEVLLDWYKENDMTSMIPSITLPLPLASEENLPKDNLLEQLSSPDRVPQRPSEYNTPNHRRKTSIAMMLASPPASPSNARVRQRSLTAEAAMMASTGPGSAGSISSRLMTDDLLASPAGRKALGVKVLTSSPSHLPLISQPAKEQAQVKNRASSLLERIRAKETAKTARDDRDLVEIEAGGLGTQGRKKRSVEIGRLLEGGCLDAIYLNFLQDLVEKSGDLSNVSKTSAKSVRELAQSIVASSKVPLAYQEAVDVIQTVHKLCPSWLSLGTVGGSQWAVLSTGKTTSTKGQAGFAESLQNARSVLLQEAKRLQFESV